MTCFYFTIVAHSSLSVDDVLVCFTFVFFHFNSVLRDPSEEESDEEAHQAERHNEYEFHLPLLHFVPTNLGDELPLGKELAELLPSVFFYEVSRNMVFACRDLDVERFGPSHGIFLAAHSFAVGHLLRFPADKVNEHDCREDSYNPAYEKSDEEAHQAERHNEYVFHLFLPANNEVVFARLRTPFRATRADADFRVLESYLRAVRTVAVAKYEQVKVLLELLCVENLGTVEVVWLRRYTEELLHNGVVVELV